MRTSWIVIFVPLSCTETVTLLSIVFDTNLSTRLDQLLLFAGRSFSDFNSNRKKIVVVVVVVVVGSILLWIVCLAGLFLMTKPAHN